MDLYSAHCFNAIQRYRPFNGSTHVFSEKNRTDREVMAQCAETRHKDPAAAMGYRVVHYKNYCGTRLVVLIQHSASPCTALPSLI